MRFIGHTMGTPGESVEEAAELFAAMGMDGMELVCRDGDAFSTAVDDGEARRLAEFARARGVRVATLTPYAWDINSPDPVVSAEHLAELERAIDLAAVMGAEFVRAYGGRETVDDPEGGFERAVNALQQAGQIAGTRGIVVLVENHPGTTTRTGEATRRLVDRIGLPSVRALYDPANVLYDTDEPWETTFQAQRGIVGYVHVKDYDDRGGTRHACNVGDGVVPWDRILPCLVAAGWDGCLSFEYEKKWYPDDLADASVGMKRSLDVARELLAPRANAGGAKNRFP